MPVESHYFSRWYWYSIITYAYGHYFSGAINMCCDPGALDLTSHACLLLAEACFKSVTSVFSRTNLVSLPSLTAQLKTRKFLFSFLNSMAHWPFHMVASDLCWLDAGSHRGTVVFYTVPFWRSMGLPLKTCHFLYFCSLSPDTHEMQWSLQFVLMVFFPPSAKADKNETNWSLKSLWTEQSGQKLPAAIQSNSETLHPMWGLSGFVFFYLRCLCSAISM